MDIFIVFWLCAQFLPNASTKFLILVQFHFWLQSYGFICYPTIWPHCILQGYAYILTHPGLPSVFYDHFYDLGDSYHVQIAKLVRYSQLAIIPPSLSSPFSPRECVGFETILTSRNENADRNSETSGHKQQITHSDCWGSGQSLCCIYWGEPVHENWGWFVVSFRKGVDSCHQRTPVRSLAKVDLERTSFRSLTELGNTKMSPILSINLNNRFWASIGIFAVICIRESFPIDFHFQMYVYHLVYHSIYGLVPINLNKFSTQLTKDRFVGALYGCC